MLPLASVIAYLLCCDYVSLSSVLSPHFQQNKSSGIIHIPYATFVPNLFSFAASIVELAHGEKSRTQPLTHPAYLMP